MTPGQNTGGRASPSVDQVLRDYRARLLARDADLAAAYARRWLRVEDALEAQYLAAAMEAAELRASGAEISESMVYRMERYQALLGQAQAETERFGQFAAGKIEREQWLAAQDGVRMGERTIAARMGQVGIELNFARLPVDAMRAMIGLSGDGTPLAQLLAASYPEAVTELTQALIDGLALGYNPRKVARMMADAMAGNLQRALLISRTEQMRAFRVAQVQSYRTSGVVSGYRRRCAISSRTCLACLLEDGKFYATIEQYSDHPGGRCSAEPVLAHYDDLISKTNGRQYFEGLDPSAQREMMGEEYFRAWKSGAFSLDQVSRTHSHPVWGDSPRIVPLKELTDANR